MMDQTVAPNTSSFRDKLLSHNSIADAFMRTAWATGWAPDTVALTRNMADFGISQICER